MKAEEFKGPDVEKCTKFFMDSFAPVRGLRRSQGLLISARDNKVAHVEGMGDEEGTREARNVGLACGGSSQRRWAEVKEGVAKGVVGGLSRRSSSGVDVGGGSKVGARVTSRAEG